MNLTNFHAFFQFLAFFFKENDMHTYNCKKNLKICNPTYYVCMTTHKKYELNLDLVCAPWFQIAL